jgi:hypothetical protein
MVSHKDIHRLKYIISVRVRFICIKYTDGMSNRVTCIGVHSRKGVVCHIVDVMLVEKLLVDDPGSVRYHFVDPPLRFRIEQ